MAIVIKEVSPHWAPALIMPLHAEFEQSLDAPLLSRLQYSVTN